ncbi:MAG: hypothetical protein IJJ17_03675, partial [Parasporobacterium sp.]|nr:hypothetical protein [Parasporobacterium sp.]
GIFNDLINTAYYFFDGMLCSEMAGVTNMAGHDITAREGEVTYLIDKTGGTLNVALPGGVTVGSSEQEVLEAFPQFQNLPGDGTAYVLGDEEFIYGSNTRSDGTFGYLLIKNDAPYYSSLSIICENGNVREISFECIGNIRADGLFLY